MKWQFCLSRLAHSTFLSQVMAAIPDIQLEVTYFLDNFGFAVRLPSALYFNKTEGLCGESGHICTKMYFQHNTHVFFTAHQEAEMHHCDMYL